MVAAADGKFDEEEVKLLDTVSQALEMSRAHYQGLMAELHARDRSAEGVRMARGQRIGASVAGAVMLALLLALPAVLFRPAALLTPGLALYLALSATWCFWESFVQPLADSDSPRSGLPMLHGLVLALVALVGPVEVALRSASDVVVLGWSPWAPWAIGASLIVGGIGLRLAAISTLGRWFRNDVALGDAQPIVDRGIYGVLRHPSEAGNLLIFAGAAVLLSSTAMLLATAALLLPVTLVRVAREDDLMARERPAPFAAYRDRVPALLPFMRWG